MMIYDRDGDFLVLLIYVGDMHITRNKTNLIQSFFERLNYVFSLKDLGNLNYFLGVEITKTSDE